jgi:chromosome segregation ATPase
LSEKCAGYESQLAKVNENSSELEDLEKELGEAVKEILTLKQSVNEKDEQNSKLVKQVSVLEQRVLKADSATKMVNEQLSDLGNSSNKKLQAVDEAYKKEIKALNERFEATVNSYKEEVLKSICSIYKVQPSMIKEGLKKDFTSDDVHLLCEAHLSNRNRFNLSTDLVIDEQKEEHEDANPVRDAYSYNRRGFKVKSNK